MLITFGLKTKTAIIMTCGKDILISVNYFLVFMKMRMMNMKSSTIQKLKSADGNNLIYKSSICHIVIFVMHE